MCPRVTPAALGAVSCADSDPAVSSAIEHKVPIRIVNHHTRSRGRLPPRILRLGAPSRFRGHATMYPQNVARLSAPMGGGRCRGAALRARPGYPVGDRAGRTSRLPVGSFDVFRDGRRAAAPPSGEVAARWGRDDAGGRGTGALRSGFAGLAEFFVVFAGCYRGPDSSVGILVCGVPAPDFGGYPVPDLYRCSVAVARNPAALRKSAEGAPAGGPRSVNVVPHRNIRDVKRASHEECRIRLLAGDS